MNRPLMESRNGHMSLKFQPTVLDHTANPRARLYVVQISSLTTPCSLRQI
jgi:hypothetical protein